MIDVYSGPEPFAIICNSDCVIVGNRIEKCWGGGISIMGSRTRVLRNCLSDLGGFGIVCWSPRYDSAAGAGLAYVLYHYLNSPQRRHKGVALGTVVEALAYVAGTSYAIDTWVHDSGVLYRSLSAGNQGHTPATSPEYWQRTGRAGDAPVYAPFYAKGSDESVPTDPATRRSLANYYPCDNVIQENVVARAHYLCIDIQAGVNCRVLDNKLYQGVPNLVEAQPDQQRGRQITRCGLGAIGLEAAAVDCAAFDNEIHIRRELKYRDNEEWQVLANTGLAYPLGCDLTDYKTVGNTTYRQPVVYELFLRNNRVIGWEQNPTVDVTQASTFNFLHPAQKTGANPLTNLFSDSYYGADLGDTAKDAPVIECVFEGGGVSGLPVECSPFLLARGRFNLVNGLRVSGTAADFSYLKRYMFQDFGGSSARFRATGRRVLHIFPFRDNTKWFLRYDARLARRDDAAFLARLVGTILFQYDSGGVRLFEHAVEQADFRTGTIEVETCPTLILPNHLTVENRTLNAHYRGGVRFYANPFDYSLYGVNVDSGAQNPACAIDNPLLFCLSGECSELAP